MPVLAIAGNLLRELARRRSAILFAAMVIILAAAIPQLEREGTLRSRLQVAVVHGAGLPVFLVVLAMVFVAAGSIARDLERGQAQVLAVKPIRRAGILLGKLIGSLAAGGTLLALVFIALAINVRLLERGGAAASDQEAARERFFTSRRGIPASIPALDADAVARFVASRGTEAREWSPREAAALARALAWRRVAPGEAAPVVFEGLREREGPGAAGDREVIVLRFVLLTSPAERSGFAECVWEAPEGAGGAARFAHRVTAGVGLPLEVPVPAGLAAGGKLALALRNPGEGQGVIHLDLGRTEVLEAHGTFLSSAARGFLIIFARAAFLAAVGILGGALFTFPTAGLLGSFVYLTALLSSFLKEAFTDVGHVHDGALSERVAAAAAKAGEAVVGVLPDFASFDPLAHLAAGRAITGGDLLSAAGWTGLVQAGVVFLAACFLFARRELARQEGR